MSHSTCMSFLLSSTVIALAHAVVVPGGTSALETPRRLVPLAQGAEGGLDSHDSLTARALTPEGPDLRNDLMNFFETRRLNVGIPIFHHHTPEVGADEDDQAEDDPSATPSPTEALIGRGAAATWTRKQYVLVACGTVIGSSIVFFAFIILLNLYCRKSSLDEKRMSEHLAADLMEAGFSEMQKDGELDIPEPTSGYKSPRYDENTGAITVAQDEEAEDLENRISRRGTRSHTAEPFSLRDVSLHSNPRVSKRASVAMANENIPLSPANEPETYRPSTVNAMVEMASAKADQVRPTVTLAEATSLELRDELRDEERAPEPTVTEPQPLLEEPVQHHRITLDDSDSEYQPAHAAMAATSAPEPNVMTMALQRPAPEFRHEGASAPEPVALSPKAQTPEPVALSPKAQTPEPVALSPKAPSPEPVALLEEPETREPSVESAQPLDEALLAPEAPEPTLDDMVELPPADKPEMGEDPRVSGLGPLPGVDVKRAVGAYENRLSKEDTNRSTASDGNVTKIDTAHSSSSETYQAFTKRLTAQSEKTTHSRNASLSKHISMSKWKPIGWQPYNADTDRSSSK